MRENAAGGSPESVADSLTRGLPDSASVATRPLIPDSARLLAGDSLSLYVLDSTLVAATPSDSLAWDSLHKAEMPRRELRRLERAERKADSTLKYHYLFRDSIPISRLTALSVVVPGLSQLYNKQAWKIPILYGTVATGIYFGVRENKDYKFYKKHYDRLLENRPAIPNTPGYNPAEYEAWRRSVDPIQDKMIRHNTSRQLLLGGALAAYIYFLGDGAVNYPGELTRVKKATTLSTICPGAGQIYNGSYWKVPIVVGGIATMAYVIDWNNRGYKRFKLAFDQISDAERKGTERYDEFRSYGLSKSQIQTYRNSYRRNRDLCIILTCGFYLLNIVDAHVDAHLKDYDISDDLTYTFGPSISTFQLASTGMSTNLYGVSFKMTF